MKFSVYLTTFAIKPSFTGAFVVIDFINTGSIVFARVGFTFINVYLTVFAFKS